MAEKIISVEDILEKTTSKNQPYWILRSKGEGYFVWDKEMLRGVSDGDTIKIEYTPSKYPRVNTILPQKILPIAQETRKPTPKTFPVELNTYNERKRKEEHEKKTKDEEKRDDIIRSVALKGAIEFIASGQLIQTASNSVDNVVKRVLDVAEKFEEWLKR